MARHGSDSLFPVQIPITPDTLSIKSVRTKVSLDPNNLPLVLSEDEKSWLNDEYFKSQMAEEEAWWKEYEKQPQLRAINTTYSVGAIPLQEGVSPTGARTYSLPIPTAAGFKLVPNVSLAYNSQASEGWAGYNWDIQGISCIRLINKNEYYHDEIKAADATASDPVFALDGVPLVTNEHSATSSAYPLETARGHILATTETNSYGRVTKFTVLYPNGVRAVYGRSHSYNYNLVFYKLSEMTDLEGNKITFSYTIDSISGNDYITSIRYGYDSENNYSGEINFTYTDWADCPIRYFAGKTIRYTGRLSSIESRSDGEILATYNFTYQQSGPLWLLNRIECTSGTASLPPVEFTYPSIPASQYLKKDSQSITLGASFQIAPLYKRGKFLKGEYRDGILIYPNYAPYSARRDPLTSAWEYGCFSPKTQRIVFIPRLEGNSHSIDTLTLSFGEGFQTMDAVDVDGDGVDEMVKVNLDGVSNNKTKVRITTYKCNNSGEVSDSTAFVVSLNGAHYNIYPYNRVYRWGDFNGDGKADLLAVAYNRNIDDEEIGLPQNCYTALIDLDSQSVITDSVLFDFSIDKEECLFVYDIDGDGRTELCHAENDGIYVFRLWQSNHFSLDRILLSPLANIFTDEDRPIYFADINGDGYLDIARTPSSSSSSSWTIYYYNGHSFTQKNVTLAQPSSFTSAMFMDVNHDGMADMVTVKKTSATTATLGTYMSLNGYSFGSYQLSPHNVKDAKGIVPVNVSAYNKPSAFMKVDNLSVYNYSYQGLTASSRHLLRVKDSYGKVHSSGYAYLPARSSSWSDASLTVNTSQGYKFYTLPISVLSLEIHYMSESIASSYSSLTYEYYNGVVHNWGLGFCGFSRIRTKEMASPTTFYVNDYTDTYFLPEKMGVVSKVERRKGPNASNLPYYTLNNTWDSHSTTYGKLSPRLTQSVSNDALTGVNARTYYTYDQWDYTTEVRVERLLSGAATQRERQKFTYLHCNTPTKYVLGIVTNESHWQDLDGQATRQWKNKFLTTYDSVFHPLTRKSYVGISRSPAANPYYEAVDSTALVSETRWTYDSHGNVLTEKSAPYNATEFTGHTYTYDANGRYLLTDTDALGHTTVYANYNKFGKPSRMDDYRSRSTSYTYDSWGRVTTVTHIDGTVENTSYAWGGTGTYTVTSSINGGPQSVTHYDALDREVRRGSKRFDGQWQYTDTKYNRNGQVSQSSLPFKGSTPTYWNTYSYDTYHRPTKIAEASGKETTWSYSGTSVTTVKDGITSVSTKDASGNVVSVQDAGGTITYTLRDDGQPSKITAPGNVETTFTYDNYGRRTSIIDPSAGTRTEAYVWNADGSHEQTHTGPNGSITTSWDKYGRTTSVVRPGEFNTTYTYNTYGLLSNEQSTNGTGTEYTYDSYDRIATVKETVPDSKWLKKTYTYGSWGNVSTIKYTTQGGDITTETYSYANGNNTGVSITGGTTVWSLVEENDLGMPTKITTGSVTREYGFTDFGLPTYRKMDGEGTLQNFTYSFNVNTGNLSGRTDVVNGKSELFDYDSLNRLVMMNSREVYYGTGGNITYISSVGSLGYTTTDKPYQVTSLTPSSTSLVPTRTQEITYNSLDRPSLLEEGTKSAAFTYNAAGDRVKMQVTDGITNELTRYYIGGQYEYDTTSSGTTERLYLGGDAYSAPMVLQRTNGGSWTAYNIGRDYLGSITHIVTSSGILVAEYSYDPWGRLRNPATQAIYTPGTEPDLFLGRGYTGHEHLTWFGLINMNARLYDPLLGRFLSPDPYVQALDFTQNFNRYSYALNNPLKYTDYSGEFFGVDDAFIIGAIVGAVFGAYSGGVIANEGEYNPIKWAWDEQTFGYMIAGAAFGGMSGYLGSYIAASGIPFANTLSMMASSLVNSIGTHIYTEGQSPISVNFGFASYDFSNNTWNYLGRKGNKWYENLGYGLGALANISDILLGLSPRGVDLVTENSDAVGHSAIVEEGTMTGAPHQHDPSALISVGPDRQNQPTGSWHWMKGTNNWDSYSWEGASTNRINLKVNYHTISNYSKMLDRLSSSGKLIYSVELSSCVTHTSMALNLSGLFNIGIHPYLLSSQMYLWSNGIRPWSYLYFLY